MSSDVKPSGSRGYLWLLLIAVAVAAAGVLMMLLFRETEQEQKFHRGGLPAGTPFPEIYVHGWLNGPGPKPENLKGKVLVVDAWAYWCEPCLLEAPHLVEAYNEYHDKGVVFIGLTADLLGDKDKMMSFIDRAKVPWPCGYGARATLTDLQVEFIPQVWVVGTDGKIRWTMDSPGSMNTAIEEALALRDIAADSSDKKSRVSQKGQPAQEAGTKPTDTAKKQ
jgi:thiol-disulfide isomerase/thioredoxin